MAVLGLRCRSGFSLVAVPGLLTVVASLVAEHGLRAAGFSSCGSPPLERSPVLVARGLRCSEACGICHIRD